MSAELNVIPSTDTRTLILDATEQIMIEDGYSGVSSRKVALRAGLKSKLLHYYFASMDDLFIAAFQRREDLYFANFAKASASKEPLHRIWELGVDGASGKLILEFNAAASHRPALRKMIARSARRDRLNISGAFSAIFDRYEINSDEFPPKVMATLMAGLAQALSTEQALGMDEGHQDAREFVSKILRKFEPAGTAGVKSGALQR